MKIGRVLVWSCLTINFILSCRVKISEKVEEHRITLDLGSEEVLKKGNFYYQKDDFNMARKYYTVLIDQKEVYNGELYYKRGYCNAQLLNLTESTKDYLKAAEIGHRAGDAYFNAGVNQTLALNDSLAVIFFEKAIEINPNDTSAIYELKNARERIERFEKVFKN